MTVIAARRSGRYVEIGCDTLIAWGGTKLFTPTKLIRIGTVVLGSGGACAIDNALHDYLSRRRNAPPLRTDLEIYRFFRSFRAHWREHGGADYEYSSLLASPGGLFSIDSDLAVLRHDYLAIGSGGPYALGCLEAGLSVKEALAVAIALDTRCGGEIRVEKIKLSS